MKIKTDITLLNLKGEPLKDQDEVITLGSILCNILSFQQTENPHKSYKLSKMFASNDKQVEVVAEDIVYIKEIINKTKGIAPITLGQIIDLLEENK